MLIKFLTGPRKGQTRHCERSKDVQWQIDLGNIEEVVDPNAPPKPQPGMDFSPYYKPTWSIELLGTKPCITFRQGRETTWFDGLPSADFINSRGWPPVPCELLARWKRRITPEQQAAANNAAKEKAYWQSSGNR